MQAVRTVKRLDLENIEQVIGRARPGAPLIWTEDRSVAAEKFRLLAHRLHRARGTKPIQTILVASAIPREGRSTVAVNLAATLARQGKGTVLIDADLRLSELQRTLGVEPRPGLSEALAGGIEVDRALRRVDPPGLYFLAAGARTTNPVPLLEAPRFVSVLQELRESFEWVILDSAPLNPLADSQCVASVCDATLLVIRWGVTPRNELEHAMNVLDGNTLLGIVINMFDDPQDSNYYRHYDQSKPATARARDSTSFDAREPSAEADSQGQHYFDTPTEKRG